MTTPLKLRIVFDGPAEAGKTTSIEKLAVSLGVSVVSPASRGRRTLFFDWTEYHGGRFGGAPIQCQLVSVPGQQQFFERRKRILETADVVVFVADSAPSRVQASRSALEQLLEICAARGERSPRILVQANKRDLPGAVSLHELTSGVAGASDLPHLETCATQSTGLQRGFVQAVRLGIERTRELDTASFLGSVAGGDSPDDVESLFASLVDSTEWLDGSALVEGESLLVDRGSANELSAHARLGNARPGSVWPPFEGRMYLEQASDDEVSWIPWRDQRLGVGGDWLYHSGVGDRFENEADAHRRLVQSARLHTTLRHWLCPERCLVALPDDRDDDHRIWQVARRTRSCQDVVDGVVWESPSPKAAVDALADVWGRLLEVTDDLRGAPVHIDLGLDNLRASTEHPRIVGIVRLLRPEDQPAPSPRALGEMRTSIQRLLERHHIDLLRTALEDNHHDVAFTEFFDSALEEARRPDR